jgi:protein O-GlcNAc transferase
MLFKLISKLTQKNHSKDSEIAIKEKFQKALSLHQEGKLFEAKTIYSEIIQLNPKHANSLHFLGLISYQTGDLQHAINLINQAISINPNSATFYSNLGVALMDLQLTEQALDAFEKAIILNPNNADFHYNKGNILANLKLFDKALSSYNRAIELNPDINFIFDYLLNTKMQICNWDNFDKLLLEITKRITNGEKATPFAMLSLIDDPEIHRKTAETYVKERHPATYILPTINHPEHSKIRIGYFSSDFKNHPVSALTAGLYKLHDRSKFEIHAFSLSFDSNDEMNIRIKAGVDHFHCVHAMSDQDIAMLARNLEIDIAIDLGGHTKEARTSIFAMRAAPIQISYIGYLGTMGADYFDYLIADKVIIPEESQKYYSEKIIYLPSYQVNDSEKQLPTNIVTRKEFGLPENGFVFCCFNNTYKITPNIFDSWIKILKKVDGSLLLIFVENEMAEENLKKEVLLRDFDLNRIIFAKRLPIQDYLARYQIVDLFLDTIPYNAGTTASDALRMKVPVLTCMGKSFASRMAASLLTTINLSELITTSLEEYENLAIEIATNSEKLKSIKDTLANNLPTTPLFNTKLFTKNIELAYAEMYNRNRNGLNLDHIYVEKILTQQIC